MQAEFPDILPESAPEQNKPSVDADALTRALRVAGAVLVVASASTFMLQHWESSGNDLARYGMLVGQSLLLVLAAYFVGLTVRDGKGARTFLALLLATMPVSFAVLGGLVYSQFHVEPLASLPHYASWIAPTKASALLAVLGTLVVLVPLGAVAFLVLARRHARSLGVAFFTSNIALLLPVREPSVIAGLLAVTVLGLLLVDGRRVGRLDTLEGWLARSAPFAAPLLMAGRVFHLYRPTTLYVGALFLIAACATWIITARSEQPKYRALGAWPSGVLSLLGWFLCWIELCRHHGSNFVALVSLGLPSAALLFMASTRARRSRSVLSGLAMGVLLLTAVLGPFYELSTLPVLICLLIGIAFAVAGAGTRSWPTMLLGGLVALFGLGAQVLFAVRADDLLRWGSLSAVGVALILGASYLERHKARLSGMADKWRLKE
jgi:hypothetical protein